MNKSQIINIANNKAIELGYDINKMIVKIDNKKDNYINLLST